MRCIKNKTNCLSSLADVSADEEIFDLPIHKASAHLNETRLEMLVVRVEIIELLEAAPYEKKAI